MRWYYIHWAAGTRRGRYRVRALSERSALAQFRLAHSPITHRVIRVTRG